ncbi:MAG: oligosaccharide flippase family protein [Bacteroidia bacterium]|nr:oligosaccharide flippase family protein [Bacteroidia bacterium]
MKLPASLWNNLLFTGIQFVLPLITMTWMAHQLGVDGFGSISVAEYFSKLLVLIATLGIPYFGAKSLAQCSGLGERKQLFSSLLGILLFALVILLGLLVIVGLYKPPVFLQSSFLPWVVLFLVSQALSLEWYFQGIQTYRFVIVRTLVLRVLGLLATIWLVKGTRDVYKGFVIMSLTQCAIAVFTLWHVRDSVNWRLVMKPKLSLVQRKQLLWLSLSTLCITGYTTLDTLMLGWFSNSIQTGWYTLSVRLTKLPLMIMGAVVMVLMIQGAGLVKQSNHRAFSALVQNSFRMLWIVLLPMAEVLFIGAGDWLWLWGGRSFKEAEDILRIVAWILPFMAISNVAGIQVLLAQNRERDFLKVVSVALLGSILGYARFIPLYGAKAAAWVTLCTEAWVALGSAYYAWSWIKDRVLRLFLFRWLIAMLPLGGILYGVSLWNLPPWLQLLVMGIFVILYAGIVLFWILKEKWISLHEAV